MKKKLVAVLVLVTAIFLFRWSQSEAEARNQAEMVRFINVLHDTNEFIKKYDEQRAKALALEAKKARERELERQAEEQRRQDYVNASGVSACFDRDGENVLYKPNVPSNGIPPVKPPSPPPGW